MPFKLNIGQKGKSWKLETDAEYLAGKSIGATIEGKEITQELEDYTFEITGGSDHAGFPLSKNVEGIGLKRLLLTRGWGMHEKTKGLRRRKTTRGKIIASTTTQINLKVIKEGKKPLEEIFPDQNKPKEKQAEQKAQETPAQ